ncbi:MAG TPA: YdeI/OmpD-associated family protein [Candidatus Paceibacterota bacterium]|nr:YdeI/OmpD-associated family protein [Candidatus Paceibacterota bacterium]
MDIGKTIYVTKRKDWHKWLVKNSHKEKEIWLIYYRKDSGKPRILYNDAVEEAICYGWIDSTIKNIDEERFAQRFTPRRANSVLSEMNKERVRRLIKNKKMTPIGLKSISHVFDKDKEEVFVIASDILEEIKNNKQAWKNFQKFSEGYKRVRIGYIESQRKHSMNAFKKSLQNFIKNTEKNKRFGMIQ